MLPFIKLLERGKYMIGMLIMFVIGFIVGIIATFVFYYTFFSKFVLKTNSLAKLTKDFDLDIDFFKGDSVYDK